MNVDTPAAADAPTPTPNASSGHSWRIDIRVTVGGSATTHTPIELTGCDRCDPEDEQ